MVQGPAGSAAGRWWTPVESGVKQVGGVDISSQPNPGDGLATGGVMLPTALAGLRLIDEHQFVVHPHVAGRGPTVLAGLSAPLELELVDRVTVTSGAVATRYVPRT